MRLKVGDTTFESCVFLMSVVRQKASENSSAYNVISAYTHLKKSFHLISIESAQDKEMFRISNSNYRSIQLLNLDFENCFGVELSTTDCSKECDSILILFSVDTQSNLFIVEQAGLLKVLSKKSIESLINSTLFGFHSASGASESFSVEVNHCTLSKQPQSIIEKHKRLLVKIKDMITQGYIQLSMFDDMNNSEENLLSYNERYSIGVFNSFEVARTILESKKQTLANIYNLLYKLVPKEPVSFSMLSINQALVCEMICAALCHQINWDYLRRVVLNKTLIEPSWIEPINLAVISTKTVASLLSSYEKANRIRAEERTNLLRILGTNFANLQNGFVDIFFTEAGLPQNAVNIYNALISCPVFSNDPVEKKLQLLLQKLAHYAGFGDVGNYCKPTIDYHLIRSFLRRGLLIPKTKRAKEIISSDRIREEKTIGAIRKHCANIVMLLSELTNQSVASINSIEWWIGRTICNDDNPDCLLENVDASWLNNSFIVCPFKIFCSPDSVVLSAPKYSGNSY